MYYHRKIWEVLTAGERRRAVGLAALMIIGMGMETIGVGLVIPVLALLTNPRMSTRHPLLERALAALGDPSPNTLITAVVGALVFVYVIKTAFLAFLVWRQTGFAYEVQAHLSQRLLALYLRQPYAFLLERNSAHLLRNMTSDVNAFTTYALTPCLNILAELLVLSGLGALLLWVEPVGAVLIAVVMGGAGWLFHRMVRARVLRWGEARQYHEGLRLQHAQQGLGGVKEVKLAGREEEFIGEYHVHNTTCARMAHFEQGLGQMPRLGFELLAVCALALLVFVLMMRGHDVAAVLPKVGLFAAAAFRVLPSITRLFGAMQSFKYSQPFVSSLHAELQLERAPSAGGEEALPFERGIEFRDVTFAYAGRTGPAVSGISLSIQRGESIGIVGTSGAGKSTLVDLLLGLLEPTSGKIFIDGADLQPHLRGWQRLVGYVPQTIFLTDDTLRRNVAFGVPPAEIDDAAVRRAIRTAQLDDFVRELPDGLETRMGERGVRLSGGQRQRIALARALYRDPPVLVLDEATASLDNAIERSLMAAVSALHGAKTLIIVAHRLSTVEQCDRLYRLERGTVVACGTFAELFELLPGESSARVPPVSSFIP